MKILITGHKGFIGQHLFKRLANDGHEVLGMDKEDGGILNKRLLALMCKDVDIIYHLAAISNIADCEENKLLAHDVNVTGTANVLMVARELEIPQIVFASSAAVYNPISFYAVTKKCGEEYCWLYDTVYGGYVSALRLFNVYGKGQYENAVILSFINQLKQGNELHIKGSGYQSRDFIYIEDVVDALITHPRGIHNVGTGIATTINDVGKILCHLMGKEFKPVYYPQSSNDVNYSKSVGSFVIPKYTLAQGIMEMLK